MPEGVGETEGDEIQLEGTGRGTGDAPPPTPPHHIPTIALEVCHLTSQCAQIRGEVLQMEQQSGMI